MSCLENDRIQENAFDLYIDEFWNGEAITYPLWVRLFEEYCEKDPEGMALNPIETTKKLLGRNA